MILSEAAEITMMRKGFPEEVADDFESGEKLMEMNRNT